MLSIRYTIIGEQDSTFSIHIYADESVARGKKNSALYFVIVSLSFYCRQKILFSFYFIKNKSCFQYYGIPIYFIPAGQGHGCDHVGLWQTLWVY